MKATIALLTLLASVSSFACIQKGCTSNHELSAYIQTHTRLNGVNDERLIVKLSEADELTVNQKKALIAIYFKSGSFNTNFQRRAIDLVIDQKNLTNTQVRLIEIIVSNSQYYNGVNEAELLPVLIRKDIDSKTADLFEEIILKPFNPNISYTASLIAILSRCPDLL